MAQLWNTVALYNNGNKSAALQLVATLLWHANWIVPLQVRDSRVPLLKKAADRLLEGSKFSSLRQEMDSFRSQNPWVEDSALFFCLIKLQVRCHGICKYFLFCRNTSFSRQANSLWSSHMHRCQQHSMPRALPGRQFSCSLLSGLHSFCLSQCLQRFPQPFAWLKL